MSPDPQSAQLEHKVTFLNLWIVFAWAASPMECRAQGTVYFSNDGFPIITNDLQASVSPEWHLDKT